MALNVADDDANSLCDGRPRRAARTQLFVIIARVPQPNNNANAKPSAALFRTPSIKNVWQLGIRAFALLRDPKSCAASASSVRRTTAKSLSNTARIKLRPLPLGMPRPCRGRHGAGIIMRLGARAELEV